MGQVAEPGSADSFAGEAQDFPAVSVFEFPNNATALSALYAGSMVTAVSINSGAEEKDSA